MPEGLHEKVHFIPTLQLQMWQ